MGVCGNGDSYYTANSDKGCALRYNMTEIEMRGNNYKCSHCPSRIIIRRKAPTKTPINVPIEPAVSRIISRGGYQYRTLMPGVSMFSPSIGCDSTFRPIPSGWDISPVVPNMCNFHWGTWYLVFQNGSSYTTTGFSSNSGVKKYSHGEIIVNNSAYKCLHCPCRILIRKKEASSKLAASRKDSQTSTILINNNNFLKDKLSNNENKSLDKNQNQKKSRN